MRRELLQHPPGYAGNAPPTNSKYYQTFNDSGDPKDEYGPSEG